MSLEKFSERAYDDIDACEQLPEGLQILAPKIRSEKLVNGLSKPNRIKSGHWICGYTDLKT